MSNLEDKFEKELKNSHKEMMDKISPLLAECEAKLAEAETIVNEYGLSFRSRVSPIRQTYAFNLDLLCEKYSDYLSQITDKKSDAYNENYDGTRDAMKQIYETVTGEYIPDDYCNYAGWTHSAVCY